jgi:hypothetical protein
MGRRKRFADYGRYNVLLPAINTTGERFCSVAA